MSKYSIGLDLGTNSVGWAVVDENNQLVKKNGFTLWGVRMFDEAKDASETRTHRTNRRRLERRKFRIKLLREIFNDEINKVDPTFFERLDDSFYKIEDKRNANFYNLFIDSYTDKDFFNEYPTIYHLRKHLCLSNQKEDIRLIYLALHHMVKYRGNFLYQGDTFNKSNDERVREVFNDLNYLLVELSNEMEDNADYFKTVTINDDTFDKLKNILISQSTKNDKKRELKSLFDVDTKTLVNECIIPLIIGSKCNFSGLAPVKQNKYEKCEITLFTENLETLIEESKTKVPELSNVFEMLSSLKEVVDYYFLIKLLQDGDSLSDAMINKYNEHNSDLRILKKLIKEYIPNKYNECFRKIDDKLNNYVKYVGFNSTNQEMNRFAHCSREDFYAYVIQLLKSINSTKADETVKYILNKIDNNDFLLRQNSDQNGSLPMQLNLSELVQIIENQSEFYPFLSFVDEEGISTSQKIISIFKFIVPYYIGPLNKQSKRSWLVRKDEKIYPWNFEKVIDVDESAINFIQNMQRKCTYLKGDNDYCLPKKSIIFSKYNCLSYLNKLNINGTLISYDIKMKLFEDVFLKVKKPTKKNIINYLISNFGDLNITTSKMKELPEINCDMSSYIKFTEIFEESIDDKIELIEQIIKDIVIFSDKKILEKRLRTVYGLNSEIVKKIKDLNYKDYSNLSNKLLNEFKIHNPVTGELYGTVLNIMTQTNYNLQEILYAPEYRLIDVIDKYNNSILDDSTNMSVEDFMNNNIPVTPIMKRPIIQAHTIIKEVEKILGQPIDHYYVECARTNKAEKKQTTSRYDKMKQLYSNCKSIALEYNIDLESLKSKLDANKDNLKSDLLYLYFSQLGKCMYTLEDIDISDLFGNNNKYDIDHIYPQALIKDDSFNNKVLTKKEMNNKKQDNLLFEMPGFLNKRSFAFYEKLKDLELISKEKYRRLTKKELTQSELEVFVNRQLVTTNQSVKGLIQVLKLYDKVDPTKIVYSKAENISLARQLYDLPKSRTANNFHHAHDAYLNVVIGRIINNYFVKNHFNGAMDYYRMKADNKTINVERLLTYNKLNYGSQEHTKAELIKLINRNLYSRFDVHETIRTYNSNELFSKITINPATKGTVPIKENDLRGNIEKYGGITSHSYFKYMIIEYLDKKGNVSYVLESIPKAFDGKEEYYLKQQGYVDFKIIHNNIKSNVVIEQGPLKYCITGKTGNQYLLKNLNDRFFEKYYISIIKKIDKYNENIVFDVPMKLFNDYVIISPAKNKRCNEITLSIKELKDLYNEIKNKFNKNIYSFSIINSISQTMASYNMDKLTIQDLIKVNNELLKLLQTNTRKNADLKLIGLSANTGTIYGSKKLSPGMKFVSESVTGYYSKVLFEVPR